MAEDEDWQPFSIDNEADLERYEVDLEKLLAELGYRALSDEDWEELKPVSLEELAEELEPVDLEQFKGEDPEAA